jgi:succinate dehydrogenase/fumarate reductase iron-sulfur protein
LANSISPTDRHLFSQESSGIGAMKAKLTIYRFDPNADREPRYEPFEVSVESGETVLAALIKVYEELDPSLSFRFACGKLKCGECALMVNKKPCLACEKEVEAEMTIEPLPNLPVIKDLVIDRSRAMNALFQLAPVLRRSPDPTLTTGEMNSKDVDNYIRLTACFECLMCQSSCPVLKKKPDQFVGPLGLLWLAQTKVLDSAKVADAADLADLCNACGRCWKACPSKVDFLEDAIRGLLEKGKERHSPDGT